MTSFLHGVETIRVNNSPVPINVVRTAVIGLVCTAPVHLLDAENQSVNTPQPILSDRDGGLFMGPEAEGFTGPQALRAIHDQGAGLVVMINVFDPARHNVAVSGESVTFVNDVAQLENGQVISAVVENSAGDTTFVEGVDFWLDKASGKITRIASGAIGANSSVNVDYDYADVSQVNAADIIGGVDGSGSRTGLNALKDTFALYGYQPKIVVAPKWCEDDTVAVEMVSLAEELRAEAYIDAPIGTSFQDALQGRGPSGTINFNISSDAAILSWPQVKVADGKGGTTLEGLSARLAGLRAKVDVEEGYHVSISNHEINGVVGLEVPVYANLTGEGSEANELNAQGILTVFNAYGSGFRAFGNRAASFPATSGATTFEAVRRTFDIVDESIERVALNFADKPITSALIDAIVDSVNTFIDQLVSRGALLPGSRCFYEPSKNPPAGLANGHLVLSRRYMAPTPLERLTHEAEIDINLLNNVTAG